MKHPLFSCKMALLDTEMILDRLLPVNRKSRMRPPDGWAGLAIVLVDG